MFSEELQGYTREVALFSSNIGASEEPNTTSLEQTVQDISVVLLQHIIILSPHILLSQILSASALPFRFALQ